VAKKAVLIVSGGMDSATMSYLYKNDGYDLILVGFNYGQRHVKELESLYKVGEALGAEVRVVDLTNLTKALHGSSLTSDEVAVPDGHYTEGSMKKTVVPNRNMIMLSVAIGWAVSQKAASVAYAAHAGDHAIYPDCRPEFAEAMNEAAQLADWHQVSLLRPFVQWSKADIAAEGQRLGVQFELTWSCYKGGLSHCGTCGTCVERREAFALAGITDPTLYQ